MIYPLRVFPIFFNELSFFASGAGRFPTRCMSSGGVEQLVHHRSSLLDLSTFHGDECTADAGVGRGRTYALPTPHQGLSGGPRLCLATVLDGLGRESQSGHPVATNARGQHRFVIRRTTFLSQLTQSTHIPTVETKSPSPAAKLTPESARQGQPP